MVDAVTRFKTAGLSASVGVVVALVSESRIARKVSGVGTKAPLILSSTSTLVKIVVNIVVDIGIDERLLTFLKGGLCIQELAL